MLWLLPLAITLFGLVLLAMCAWRVTREIGPTQHSTNRFGHELRPIVVRVHDENTRLRRRLDD